MNEQLARLVKQHAETSRLFGVDFVPRYRTANSFAEEVSAHDAAPAETAAATTPAAQLPPAPSAPPIPATYASSKQKAAQSLMDAARARYLTSAPHLTFVGGTKHQGNNIVFGEGDPCARLMFIGDAPGDEDDACGRPFVGRAGELLGKMIQAMGLSRQAVYLTNVLKNKLPEQTTPQPHEVEACVPYLVEQINAVRPEVIVTLGPVATNAVLGIPAEPADSSTIASRRNRWAEFQSEGSGPNGQAAALRIAVMPTYHPSYLLANYDQTTRKLVWDDLKLVMDKLGLIGPSTTK